MKFIQILNRAQAEIKDCFHDTSYLKLVVSNKRELGQLKRAFSLYKKECDALMERNNFDMSVYENYIKECDYITKVFDNAIILH